MKVADTNVVIRIWVADDAEQTAAAGRLFAAGPVWIPKTVLLEAAWVLRSVYRFEELSIRDFFLAMMGLPEVHVEDEAAISAALILVGHGLDFADALHLSSRPPGAAFVSFDRTLVQRAKRAGVTDISELKTA
jgi:predicted nucleic-acid-binding protein